MDTYKGYSIPYTICFVISGKKVLLIYRYKYPNEQRWNGLGGKLEPGENPLVSIIREIKEEADLDITKAAIHYAGIVTWNTFTEQDGKGMYAYIVDFGKEPVVFPDREIREGILGWRDISWTSEHTNMEIVANIPYFLPLMLTKFAPQHFHCQWNKADTLEKFSVEPL